MIFSNLKSLTIPEGIVTKIVSAGVTLWEAITFTNQVPISTDTDGSIYNKVGYKDNTRLSSSGGVSGSAQSGSVTTGFMPFPDGDKTVIRMKGVEWKSRATQGGHYYINFYDSSKKFLVYISAQEHTGETHIVTVTRDANGIETVEFSQTYGTTNVKLQQIRNNAKFIRINAYGKGEDMIVTINEEIT